jgi:glycosyltransferase involved in cell wall biosynthesis
MKQLISIVLPVFNVEKYIEKSIQSVLNQTYSNFELLVVDDGSNDKSIEIAKSFKDNRISIYHKENGGISDARNFGILKATGEYLYFLDSDDWIEPDLIEVCIKAINKENSDYLIFGYRLDSEDFNGNLIETTEIKHESVVFNKEHNDIYFDTHTIGLLGYVWNKFYKVSFIRDNQLNFDSEVSLFEDLLFNSRVYEASDKMVFIEDVLYHYINRPSTSLIKTFHINSFELNLKKNKAIHSFLNGWNTGEAQKRKVLSEDFVTGIRYCLNNLFAYKNDLNFFEKIKYVKMIVNHDETKKHIKFYETKSIKDRVYKTLISNQAAGVLYLLFKITK